MKKLVVVLLVFASLIAQAKVYYVSPYTGRDSDAGTDTANAWATWGKAFTSANVGAGDTVYFRGGVYMMPYNNGAGYKLTKTGTAANPVCFFAYPDDFAKGKYPILDCGNVREAPSSVFYGIVLYECRYVKMKGLTVRNLWGNNASSSNTYGISVTSCKQTTLDQCICYNTRNIGFNSNYNDTVYFINCDSYNHCDSFNLQYPGNDGYGFTDFDWTYCTSHVFYRGCRAWNCSDDGYSTTNSGLTSYDSCWSFNNGMMMGEGHGFKMGWIEPIGAGAALNRRYTHCMAVYNRSTGFTTNDGDNSEYCGSMQVYDNKAYHNGYYATRFPGSAAYGFQIYNTDDTNDEHELGRIFRNNLSYDNEDGEIVVPSGALYTHSNNSWDNSIKLTDADFLDLNSAKAIAILKGPRKADGSLPDLGNFLKLKSASDGEVIFVSGINVTGAGGSSAITIDGGTLQLTATVLPANAANKNVTWSLVNENGEATISAAGLVTAVANGTVIARATASDGSGITQVITISISNQIVPVADVSVRGTGDASIITALGGTLQLIATVLPDNATDKTVTWSIENNTGQATINSTGMVTALGIGNVTARATANDGSGVSGILSITISEALIPVSSISVSGYGGKSLINVGEETLQMNASVYPGNATDKAYTWSVDNGTTGQATISSTGLLTALANGIVTVIATANDGSGASGSLMVTIQSFPVPDSRNVYIDPTNQSDPSQDGTLDHPYGSWKKVNWKKGYSYLQKRGTISYESKINITSGDVTLGSYGDGDQPSIQSDVNDFAIRAYEKSNITIKDLHIIAVDAISCIYILGESCDSIFIEYCTLESAVNGARILDGKKVVLRYNTFDNCSEAIYCYADNSSIYYNVFRDNEVAISAMASMANAEIYNNVFYNNTIGITNTYTDLTLYNNIFYLVNSSDKAIYNNQLNQLISDNNIFYPEQEGFIQIGGKIYGSLDEYQHDLGLDLNSITDDPEFVDAFNQNFSIAPNSPAINAGKLLGLEHDFYGTRVPLGGIPDIGLAELRSYTTAVSHLNDPIRDDFQVYPNPSQGTFNVVVKTNNSNGSRITIRDLSGKLVYENICSSDLDFRQEIDISNMQKGIYIVAVEDNDRSLSQPIIIK